MGYYEQFTVLKVVLIDGHTLKKHNIYNMIGEKQMSQHRKDWADLRETEEGTNHFAGTVLDIMKRLSKLNLRESSHVLKSVKTFNKSTFLKEYCISKDMTLLSLSWSQKYNK